MAGFSASIWSNLCTRHILSELTPRGHQYWPDKRGETLLTTKWWLDRPRHFRYCRFEVSR
jgi:hypothetical protein